MMAKILGRCYIIWNISIKSPVGFSFLFIFSAKQSFYVDRLVFILFKYVIAVYKEVLTFCLELRKYLLIH